VYTATTGEKAFLDAALVVALVSFIGTVAYARYVERGGRK
jgi:multisubunit Na+/H+ antiporter MnhF subunit